MTIAERKAKEAYDRENPWRPMKDAKADGTVCELLFHDMVGDFDTGSRHFFLDTDGRWHCITDPRWPFGQPMNWRPAQVKLTPERRLMVKRKADWRS